MTITSTTVPCSPHATFNKLALVDLDRSRHRQPTNADTRQCENRVGQRWRTVRLRSPGESLWMNTGCQCPGRYPYGLFDAPVRTAAAQVAVHPQCDLGGVRAGFD